MPQYGVPSFLSGGGWNGAGVEMSLGMGETKKPEFLNCGLFLNLQSIKTYIFQN